MSNVGISLKYLMSLGLCTLHSTYIMLSCFIQGLFETKEATMSWLKKDNLLDFFVIYDDKWSFNVLDYWLDKKRHFKDVTLGYHDEQFLFIN